MSAILSLRSALPVELEHTACVLGLYLLSLSNKRISRNYMIVSWPRVGAPALVKLAVRSTVHMMKRHGCRANPTQRWAPARSALDCACSPAAGAWARPSCSTRFRFTMLQFCSGPSNRCGAIFRLVHTSGCTKWLRILRARTIYRPRAENSSCTAVD